MGKQIKIEVSGGCITNIETNFDCDVQIIDWDNFDNFGVVSPSQKPDKVMFEDENVFLPTLNN